MRTQRLTISDIKYFHEQAFPASRFFSRENMKHAGQRMKDFRVYKISATQYRIVAPLTRPADLGFGRVPCGETVRIYDTATHELTREAN